MIRAVFFDLDETLIDNTSSHLQANALAFKTFGLDINLAGQKLKTKDFMGMRVSEILTIFKQALGVSEKTLPLKKLIQTRNQIFLSLVTKKAKLLPGAHRALIKAGNQAEIVAVVSSGTREYISLCLKKFNLLNYINFLVSAEDIKRGKPFPDCYLKAFKLLPKKLHIKKDECLVIEDSINGIKAAKAAGLKTLLVPNQFVKTPIKTDWQIKSLTTFNLNQLH